MKRNTVLLLAALVTSLGFTSCADQKTAGPVSETSQIPWNTPVAGQGQGQLGMMGQNQYRR